MNLTGFNVYVVDIECDALLDDLTKLHVLSAGYKTSPTEQWNIISTNDRERIKNLVSNPDNTIIGHNFIGYDREALIKLGWEFNAKIIDTLGLSWYLYADRNLHGLESWGLDFGVPKPAISDWSSLSYEEYAHRCEEDVKINQLLWEKIYKLLMDLYEGDTTLIVKVIGLCNFLLEVLVIQANNPITLNVELCKTNLEKLLKIIEEKSIILRQVMPKVPVIALRSRPKSMYKKAISKPAKMFVKSGDLTPAGAKWMELLEAKGLPEDHAENIAEYSAAGEKWISLLKRAGLPDDYEGELKEVTQMKDPNPGSSDQVKSWLYSLGWVPRIFVDGTNGPVAQLRDAEKNLCESVLELKVSSPEIEHLEGLSVAQHRAGILKGFLESVRPDGTVLARAGKFTRTFRFAHVRPIVNLPTTTSTHGELIRSCLVPPEGYNYVTVDLKSLEDKAKQIQVSPWASHDYIHKPADYDPHIEVSIAANLMTAENGEFYKWYGKWLKEKDVEENCPAIYKDVDAEGRKKEYVRLGDVRKKGKISNYASVYQVGPAKLAKILNCPVEEARFIINAYWEIHKPVKDYAATLKFKTVDNRTWVWNPFTKLWLDFRGQHNLFSACTQNFGAVVHARLMYLYVQHGIKIISNVHDEVSFYWPKGQEEECKQIVATCVDLLNQSFGFDIKFEATPEFGDNYGSTH